MLEVYLIWKKCWLENIDLWKFVMPTLLIQCISTLRIILNDSVCKNTEVYNVTFCDIGYLQHGGVYYFRQNGVDVTLSNMPAHSPVGRRRARKEMWHRQGTRRRSSRTIHSSRSLDFLHQLLTPHLTLLCSQLIQHYSLEFYGVAIAL